jgi:putative ATP-dependent endonuclease of OLD family
MPQIMHISEIKIVNFRSIADETFELQPFSVLIGKNNAGKSNIILAISLLLEGTPASISETDFREKSRDIMFEAKVIHVSEYLDLFSDKKHRTTIEKCIIDDSIKIRRNATFGGKLSKLEIWQPENSEFGTPTGIDAALKQFLPEVILIEAFVDPASQTQVKSSTTFGKLMKQIIEPIRNDMQKLMENSFEETRKKLNPEYNDKNEVQRDERFSGIKQLEGLLKENLKKFFLDSDLRVTFEPPQVEDVMNSASLKLWDGGTWTLPNLKGQGFQRSLYVALLQTLAEQIRNEAKGNLKRPYMLLVEEPEIFLHPSLQSQMRVALEGISKGNPIVLATHCPIMLTPNTILNAILIRKQENVDGHEATKRLLPIFWAIPPDMDVRVKQLMEYQRSTAFLFADRVVVVEGPSDIALLEAIWEKLFTVTPDTDCVGFLDGGNKATVHDCCTVLRGIGLPAAGVVDLDFVWNGAGKCLKSDSEYSSFCESFWASAEKLDIVLSENGNKRVDSKKKSEGFKIIKEEFEKDVKKLRDRLWQNHGIWVLAEGEIEDYVGLTASSKQKWSEAAREIRGGGRVVKHEDELSLLLKSLKSLR